MQRTRVGGSRRCGGGWYVRELEERTAAHREEVERMARLRQVAERQQRRSRRLATQPEVVVAESAPKTPPPTPLPLAPSVVEAKQPSVDLSRSSSETPPGMPDLLQAPLDLTRPLSLVSTALRKKGVPSDHLFQSPIRPFLPILFWFVFAAFFRKPSLPQFAPHLSRHSLLHLSLLADASPKTKRFLDAYPAAAAQIVCLAHMRNCAGRARLFTPVWFDRVYILVLCCLTGVRVDERTATAIRSKWFGPGSPAYLSLPQTPVPPVAPPALPKPQKREERQREVLLASPDPQRGYEIGAYLPKGAMIDGKRATESIVRLMQKNCNFDLHRERFKFGKFPVGINAGQFQVDFNVFNTEILDYENALRYTSRRRKAARKTVEEEEEEESRNDEEEEKRQKAEVAKRAFLVKRLAATARLTSPPPDAPEEASKEEEDDEAEVDKVKSCTDKEDEQTPNFDPYVFTLCATGFKLPTPQETSKRGQVGLKRQAGFICTSTPLYNVSPLVDGTIGTPRELRAHPHTLEKTLLLGEESMNRDKYILAEEICEKHRREKLKEREAAVQTKLELLRRRNHLEQSLDKLDQARAEAHADVSRRSEFCDMLARTRGGSGVGPPQQTSGSHTAHAATVLIQTLDKSLNKLDRKLAHMVSMSRT